MSQKPDLSIIILNYKMDGLVKNCLKSIFSHQTEKRIEVIVVDNNSQDACEMIVREHFPEVTFIQTGANLGHAAGNNVGIQASSGRYIMLLNPDVVFLNPVFDALVDFMDKKQKIGMATVQLQNPDGSLQAGAWRFHDLFTPLFQRSSLLKSLKSVERSIQNFIMHDWDRRSSREVNWIQGSCMMVRRETMNKIGLMDERFFLYFTDVDWCRRCWEAGYKVYYFAEVNAIHYYNRESAHKQGLSSLTSKATRIHIRDWFRYLKKYWPRIQPKS